MSHIVNFDSSINSFLTNIINTKNNQTKEDIISGKIKFPDYTSIINEKTSFKNEENILLKNKLLRKYKISLYVEERAKLERNIYNYENQIMNLRNNKIDNSQIDEKPINVYQSTKLPTTQLLNKKPSKKKIVYKLKSSIINNEINIDNNNELYSEKKVITNYQTNNNNNEYILKNSKRVQSNYKINNNENQNTNHKKKLSKSQINDNYQYILKYERKSSSDYNNIFNNKNNNNNNYTLNNNNINKIYNKYNNFNRISNNKLYNNINKSVQFQRNAKEILQIDKYKTEYIKSLSSTIQKDILKLNQEENDYKLTLNAKAFVRRLNADKSQQDILKRKRRINDYNRQLDKDLQNYYDKKKQAEINHDLIRSMENDLKEIKYKYFGKKYINKKYHYYTPSSSRMKYGTNQLRNQLKDYSENTRTLAHEYPNIQKYKFLNIETYDNYPIKYKEDEIPINEYANYNYKYDENIDYNESPSILENTNRKSPYFFNEPKYNITLEKRIEEIKHGFDLNRKPPVPKANIKIEKKNNDNNINDINNNKKDINENNNEENIINNINENNNFENINIDNENQKDMNYDNIKDNTIKFDNYNINNDNIIENNLIEGGGIIINDE